MVTTQHKLVREPVFLEDVHSSGRAVGNQEGKRVYLEGGIPGETVTYTLERRKQGFRAGTVEAVVQSSAHRTEPFCKHYKECGGCPWQHIDYEGQLEFKHRILSNALAKYEIEVPGIPPVIPSPDTRYYRHRMEYGFAANAMIGSGDKPVRGTGLGFHKAGDPGNIVAIKECFLQPEPSRAICDFIEQYALQQGIEIYDTETRTGLLRSLSIRVSGLNEVMVTLGFSSPLTKSCIELLDALQNKFRNIVSLTYTIHPSHSHGQMQGEIHIIGNSSLFLTETLGDIRFRIQPPSFFQPNVRQAELIFITAQHWADLSGKEKVYDLYTGVGTLALFLARSAKHVIGIEGSAPAIEDAAYNARINGISNVEFVAGDILETFRPPFLEIHGKPDLVVLDPPRSGTLIEIKKTINTSGAARVIYLSCNPVSLAFDLKQLSEVYRVTRIQPFDMLPHTHHLETLVLLERKYGL